MSFFILPFLVILTLPLGFSQDAKPDASTRISTDAKSRFEELAARFRMLQEQFDAYEPKEGEDGLKRFLENHPINTMVSDFLTLEQQSRGTQIGFSCLYHLVVSAGRNGDVESPVTKGKVAALDVLGQHYHDYPDIDMTIPYVFSGAGVPESETFLRNLIHSSRHRFVRANAMYELANHLALEANLPSTWESKLAVMDRAEPENEIRIKRLESLISSLKDVNIERNRAEALSLIEQIRNHYAGEFVPPRARVSPPVIIEVERREDSIRETKRVRIADRLPAINFELNHSIGQLSPAIEGDDATGKPMSLADFREKVVVVMFSLKGCRPCEAMYPDNRQLIEELSGEPFVFVGVQGDGSIDTVHESLESKTITWRVWWDGEEKRISTQWNIEGWPTTFVLDKRGVIRFRDLRGKELANAVRRLLNINAE